MAITTVAAAQSAVLRRVRDTNGTAHADVILDVLSDCQRIVNACYGGVMIDDTLTLVPGQTVYLFTTFANDVVRVIDVGFGGKPLRRIAWEELAADNPQWLHAGGSVPQFWDTIGHALLVVGPSPLTAGTTTVGIRYIQELADLTAGGNFEVPPAYVSLVMDMACEVLLLRQRLLPSIAEAADASQRHSVVRTTSEDF